MGFFDKFKRKEQPKVEERKQPLTLKYSDGTVADITFDGSCDMEGKALHAATVIYISKEGEFTKRSLLLEPITSQINGSWVDSTEEYYRMMAERDGTQESQARYGAVKGFFKKQEITEEKIGSNYIGNIAQREDGQYFRNYDHSFRQRYNVIAEAKRDEKAREEQEKHNRSESSLREERDTQLAKGIRNQDIYLKMQEGRATQEEQDEYYKEVHHKYGKDDPQNPFIGE